MEKQKTKTLAYQRKGVGINWDGDIYEQSRYEVNMEFSFGHVIFERFVKYPSEILSGYHKTKSGVQERGLVWGQMQETNIQINST